MPYQVLFFSQIEANCHLDHLHEMNPVINAEIQQGPFQIFKFGKNVTLSILIAVPLLYRGRASL